MIVIGQNNAIRQFVPLLRSKHNILLAEDTMAQVQAFRASLVYSRRTLQRLTIWLLYGSMFGACCAKLRAELFGILISAPVAEFSLLRACLRTSLFPLLLYLVMLLERRSLYSLLFFIRGVCIGYVLCALAACGGARLLDWLPIIGPGTLLPLPLLLWTASVWSEPERSSGASWLLIPTLLMCWLGTLFASVLL